MDQYQLSMEIILNAGNAKTKAFDAIEEARNFRFEQADELINQANEELKEAHIVQTKIITMAINGEQFIPEVILIHAQDHLSMGIQSIDNAVEIIKLYRLIKEIMEKGK